MKYPVGKVSFDAKKANGVLFDEGTALWIQPFWGEPFAVTASGKVDWPAQPVRSHVVWASRECALFQSTETDEEGLCSVTRLVMLDPQGRSIREPLEVARLPQSSGAYVAHVSSDGRFASVLERGGEASVVALWSLETGHAVARHALPHSPHVLIASALADGRAFVVAENALISFPLDGGAPRIATLDGATYVGAFRALGGAARLPTSLRGDVLTQSLDGALELYSATGACLFRHAAPQAYLVAPGMNGGREARRGVAGIAPSGEYVVAAVGCEAEGTPCIEVFDRTGASIRSIAWKCGKSETAYDVAIDDDGWVALATTHRAELFAPEGSNAKRKPSKKSR